MSTGTTKEDFRKSQMINLKGKEYLPVAARVVLMRQEHPDWGIETKTIQVEGTTYVRAMVFERVNTSQHWEVYTLATAHKMVRADAKGPAGAWPLETAETGAIGRALALCGYGTLSGDLDEGDQLSDAPVEPVAKPKPSSREWRK